MGLPRILIFINNGKGTDWVAGMAIAEDGHCLAQHTSSNYDFFRYDMGLTSERKHDEYSKHYPDGYDLVEIKDPETNEELKEAYKKNQEIGRAAKEETND